MRYIPLSFTVKKENLDIQEVEWNINPNDETNMKEEGKVKFIGDETQIKTTLKYSKAGFYQAEAVVDPGNKIPEDDEANNVKIISFQIVSNNVVVLPSLEDYDDEFVAAEGDSLMIAPKSEFGNNVICSININHFIKQGCNFVWPTTQGDNGVYYAEITIESGYYKISKNIKVVINHADDSVITPLNSEITKTLSLGTKNEEIVYLRFNKDAELDGFNLKIEQMQLGKITNNDVGLEIYINNNLVLSKDETLSKEKILLIQGIIQEILDSCDDDYCIIPVKFKVNINSNLLLSVSAPSISDFDFKIDLNVENTNGLNLDLVNNLNTVSYIKYDYIIEDSNGNKLFEDININKKLELGNTKLTLDLPKLELNKEYKVKLKLEHNGKTKEVDSYIVRRPKATMANPLTIKVNKKDLISLIGKGEDPDGNQIVDYEWDISKYNREDYEQKVIFVTSGSWAPGSFDGLNGADAKCQKEADDAGLIGTYKAFLSANDKPKSEDRCLSELVVKNRLNIYDSYKLVNGNVV